MVSPVAFHMSLVSYPWKSQEPSPQGFMLSSFGLLFAIFLDNEGILTAIVHQKDFSDLYFMRRNVFGGFSGCLTCTATLPLHLTLRPGLVHVFTRHLFHLEISLELRLKGMVPHKSWHTYLHHFHVHLSFKSKLHPSLTNTHL